MASLLTRHVVLTGTLGVPVGLVIPWAPVLGAVVACLALALAVGVLPAQLRFTKS